jgi:hypothetical protein
MNKPCPCGWPIAHVAADKLIIRLHKICEDIMKLAELKHLFDLLVCQDDEVLECYGCQNSAECLRLSQEIMELERA